jgi:hypothetical protein
MAARRLASYTPYDWRGNHQISTLSRSKTYPYENELIQFLRHQKLDELVAKYQRPFSLQVNNGFTEFLQIKKEKANPQNVHNYVMILSRSMPQSDYVTYISHLETILLKEIEGNIYKNINATGTPIKRFRYIIFCKDYFLNITYNHHNGEIYADLYNYSEFSKNKTWQLAQFTYDFRSTDTDKKWEYLRSQHHLEDTKMRELMNAFFWKTAKTKPGSRASIVDLLDPYLLYQINDNLFEKIENITNKDINEELNYHIQNYHKNRASPSRASPPRASPPRALPPRASPSRASPPRAS